MARSSSFDTLSEMLDLGGLNRPIGGLSLTVAWLLVMGGCGSTPPPEADAPKPTIVAVSPAEKPDLLVVAPAATEPLAAPKGYLELEVGAVIAAPGGHAVVLVHQKREVAIPIFIGGTEALSINLRHNKRHYARPLTHDLLDAIMEKLGGELVHIQIDAIRDDTYVGAVFVRQGTEIIEVDARPSDAIALAIGSRVPIYVAEEVLEKAGVKTDEGIPKSPGPIPDLGPQPI
jgi:bifunctional DNase/RNase